MDIRSNNADYVVFLNKVRGLDLIDNTSDRDYWGYITAHHEQLHYLYDIYQEGMTFLDLGCGAGNVLRYADNIGYNVTGVDFNKDLLKHVEYKKVHSDFKDLSDNFYKEFDVIFSYRPLKKEFLIPYLEKVRLHMKKDSVLVTPGIETIKYKA